MSVNSILAHPPPLQLCRPAAKNSHPQQIPGSRKRSPSQVRPGPPQPRPELRLPGLKCCFPSKKNRDTWSLPAHPRSREANCKQPILTLRPCDGGQFLPAQIIPPLAGMSRLTMARAPSGSNSAKQLPETTEFSITAPGIASNLLAGRTRP